MTSYKIGDWVHADCTYCQYNKPDEYCEKKGTNPSFHIHKDTRGILFVQWGSGNHQWCPLEQLSLEQTYKVVGNELILEDTCLSTNYKMSIHGNELRLE